MVDFLLELNSEEIPARFLVEDVRRDVLFRDFLAKFGFADASFVSFDAPRRIAFLVKDLPATLPHRSEEIRGPKTTAPADVVAKFREKYADATFSITDTPKGAFHIATLTTPPIPLAQALAPAIADFIMTYPWPKSMTWGDTTLRWVRPLRRIVAMLDDQVLSGGLFLGHGDHPAGYVTDTTGPRILPYNNLSLGRLGLNGAPDVPVTPATYRDALYQNGIIANSSNRHHAMMALVGDECKKKSVTFSPDLYLSLEVNGLIDHPAPFIGRIDAEFMHLPAPIIKTVMAVHQKYFATQHTDGALAPYFVGVANRVDPDVPQVIIDGNERVLRARLSDAAFFWETDLKQPLESYNEHLKTRTFHAGLAALGLDATVYGKVQRMLALAPVVAGLVQGVDLPKLLRAVTLSKADLATGMVGEFPELQGQVGSFYAQHQGEDAEIVNALATQYRLEHYSTQLSSRFWGDFPLATALALVDRLDSLLSFFAAGEKTTGSKDPYGLRRLAYGIVGLVVGNPHISSFDVASVKTIAVNHQYPESQKPFADAIFQDVQAFLLDKTITFLTENADVPLEIIRTIVPQDASVDLALLAIKAKALAAFPHRETLQATITRLKGLCGDDTAPVDTALLRDPLEQQVYHGMQALPPKTFPVTQEAETLNLQALVSLSPSVNAMLDALRINDPEYGTNRRALVRALLGRYTSF